MDASASDPGVRRSLAIRLLKTTTMQNVVCPATTVRVPNWTPVNEKKEFSAIPVMMPGRASGSTSSSEIASRPKNRNWCSAYATAEPRSSASPVAKSPTRTDNNSAARTCESSQATVNQCLVNPEIGQL